MSSNCSSQCLSVPVINHRDRDDDFCDDAAKEEVDFSAVKEEVDFSAVKEEVDFSAVKEEVDFSAVKEEDAVSVGLEELTLRPRKKLLVLDLNGFLLNRIYCAHSKEIPNDSNRGSRFGNFLLYKRPFCEEFLKFCLERFEVGIWSSAMRQNAENAVSYVMGSLASKLLFVWDQSHCTNSGFKCVTIEHKRKPLFLKELKKIWSEVKKHGPFSAENTLLIDNEPYKALANPPYSGIFPLPYEACEKEEKELDNFLDPKNEFGKYLQGLAEADDVQSYVRENPFGQPAISSDHPNWDFYSAVVNSLDEK